MTEHLQAAAAPTLPQHDPATYRRLPARTRPVDRSVVERLLAQEWERFGTWSAGSGEHNKRASESLPLGRDELVPALGPVPDQRRLGPRSVADRRRRQPDARPVHGVRGHARRSPEPDGRRGRDRGTHRDRHPLRHPLAPGHRDERAVLRALPARHDPVHELRHRVADVRDPLCACLHRPQGHREGRGRLPRRLRRPADLGQARPRRDRPRRCPDAPGAVRRRGRARCTSSPTTTSAS